MNTTKTLVLGCKTTTFKTYDCIDSEVKMTERWEEPLGGLHMNETWLCSAAAREQYEYLKQIGHMDKRQ